MLLGVVYALDRPLPRLLNVITECCVFTKSDPRLLECDVEISFAKDKFFAEGYETPDEGFTIIPGITHPQSAGTIRLRSDSPLDPPLIDPRHLAEQADVDGLVRGIELSREIGDAAAFAEWGAHEVVPGLDADLERYTRQVAGTWFHPVGSCRMGIGGDAVVDPQLRVRGLRGLRVADASIMPRIVSVNTNAASMVIGWSAGELLLGEW
jgi:choline dehydrogenase